MECHDEDGGCGCMFLRPCLFPLSSLALRNLYLYTEAGRYVRSLFYDLFYWLLAGSEEDILNRKHVLSIHRTAFECELPQRKAGKAVYLRHLKNLP